SGVVSSCEQGRWVRATSAPTNKSVAETPRPMDKLPQRSLIQPAPTGPTVWPQANRLVTTASPLPQASRGRIAFTNDVAAAGTMDTLARSSAAAAHKPRADGAVSGNTAPVPTT